MSEIKLQKIVGKSLDKLQKILGNICFSEQVVTEYSRWVALFIYTAQSYTVWHEIFVGVYFFGLAIICVLRQLTFAIRTE